MDGDEKAAGGGAQEEASDYGTGSDKVGHFRDRASRSHTDS